MEEQLSLHRNMSDKRPENVRPGGTVIWRRLAISSGLSMTVKSEI